MDPKYPPALKAPRKIIFQKDLLSDRETEIWRDGWAAGQIEQARRYWKHKGDPLTKEDVERLYNHILMRRRND